MNAAADEDDFVLTISDNDDLADEEEEVSFQTKKRSRGLEKRDATKSKRQKTSSTKGPYFRSHVDLQSQSHEDEQEEEEEAGFASDFEFAADEANGIIGDFDGWGLGERKEASTNGAKKGVDVNDIVERRRQKAENTSKLDHLQASEQSDQSQEDEEFDEFEGFDDDELLAEDAFGMGATDAMEDAVGRNTDRSDEGSDSDDSVAHPVAHPMDIKDHHSADDSDSDSEEHEDPQEAARKAAFFAPEESTIGQTKADSATTSFQSMSLSRPILRGLSAIGFTEPTPIQAKTIPVALMGKDVVGGAVTGSGKTAAFMIPILERLLYRPKKVPTTRVVILMPTRELAVQCFNVAKKIASHTDITFAQIVGGFSLREQEQVLKSRPDVVIATPGRFIDHMRNSASFVVDTLEILVLDEADRMLEDGFADELNEILNTIPKSRQTMLFSATMTDSVDKLIRVGLNRPVRLLVDAKKQTVSGLVQEFVRLRPGREDKRLAHLMWLCENVYTDRVIIFFRQKKEAHRVRVIFALVGLKAAELHGSMSQEQRIGAVESFRSGEASFLLATDLASRGLDIKNVETVLNYETPQTHEIYLHRVGRTARAGRSGRACTIAAEPDRKIVKAAVKTGRAQGARIASRTVPPAEADAWYKRLQDLDEEVEEVLQEEKEEKAMSIAEREIRKGENLVLHEDEIKSRPKRTWFESEPEKKAAKKRGLAELNGDIVLSKKTKHKLSNKEKKKLDLKDERKDGNPWKKNKTALVPGKGKAGGYAKGAKKSQKGRK